MCEFKITQFFKCFLIVLLTTTSPISSALVIVNVNVKIVESPDCIINNNNNIEVDFGNILTTKIDGNNYGMPVLYSLDCKELPSNRIKLQINGSGANFDDAILQTNINGLGIELRQNNQKLPINSWVDFLYPNVPEILAIPVKQNDLILTGGDFTASATLQIAYQ